MARSKNVKHPGYYGGGGAHYMKHFGAGDVFFVNDAARGGDNANDGLSPDTPFLTITYAMTQLTGARESYIYVARTTLASETWPITINQAYLHLIGTPDQATPTPGIAAQDNNHGIVLAAGGVEIAGFHFYDVDKANLNACIYCGTPQWMNHIHHNYFAWSSEAYDCIRLENAPIQTRIHDNYFGLHGFDRYGILGSTGRINIEDNVFYVQGRIVTGTEGIRLSSDFGGVIRGNLFRIPDQAGGEAISLVGGQDCIVHDNVAVHEDDANTGQNPWLDTPDAHHWGVNYSNATTRQPA